MNSLSATYSPEDNKLRLYSLNRLDRETYDRVKAAGFIWAPKQDLFVAPMWTPERADLLLELCGDIGDEDTSLVERAEERAERFDEYREHRAEDAERAREAVAAIADNIPLGQPILVGHHSERHARKHAEQIRSGMAKAVRMWETSTYWQRRATGALRHAKYKELPAVRQRRIKTLETDKRRHERTLEHAETFAKLWSADGLTRERALKLANVDRGAPFGTWSALEDEKTTPEEARATVLDRHARTIEILRRWIAHLENRLAYERAMLGDVPTSAKPARRALPPMSNFPGDGYEHMTKAEWARIHQDYKGTRIVRGARVRTAIIKGGLSAVYLTDAKRVDPPGEGSDAPARFNDRRMPEVRSTRAPAPPTEPTAFDAMKASLRAGVKVVSAPQLFPTPAALAARMVSEAQIGPEHRVLEPSAGTGALIRAMPRCREIVTVEVNATLTDALLATRFSRCQVNVGVYRADDVAPDWVRERTYCADFLALTPDSLGTFDRIVMNPPFADAADVRHIRHALTFLAPGGRLVALCANGPRQRDALLALVHERPGSSFEPLPDGSFSEQGTSVRVALVVIQAHLEVSL